MKHIILKVLDRHKNGQFNMGSKSAREMLATGNRSSIDSGRTITNYNKRAI